MRRSMAWIAAAPRLASGVVVVSLGVAFWLFHGAGSSTKQTGQPSPGGGQTLAIAAAHSFDPPPKGDGSEKEDQVALVDDGNPGTAWTTSTYSSRPWGGLKDGIGVYVELATAHNLDRLVVTSQSQGWSGEVYVADGPAAALAGWGQPVARQANRSAGKTTFELGGAKGKAVLLWITDPGPARRFQVNELSVNG